METPPFGMFIEKGCLNRKRMRLKALFQNIFFFTALFMLYMFECNAQKCAHKVLLKSQQVGILNFTVNEGEEITIPVDFKFTAIAFKISTNSAFTQAFFQHQNKKIPLLEDNHGNNLAHQKISELIHFPQPINEIELFTGAVSGELEIVLFNGAYKGARQAVHLKVENCDQPATIEQKIWREGLSEPDYVRAFSKVNHVILHHSAGSNNSTDYYQVVRDIYLYHTQGKGWSDIGYNYLVAPDGTIFNGRDPAEGEQDNVRGAHFCAKNTGTMGICLLGTFTNVKPSSSAISSTLDLAAWKLKKEEILATSAFTHDGALLSALAGHRDGCATECPGTITYGLLEEFRNEINSKIENCNEPDLEDLIVFPVPAISSETITVKGGENDTLHIMGIHNSLGQEIYPCFYNETPAIAKINSQNMASGVYYINIYRNINKLSILRMLILN